MMELLGKLFASGRIIDAILVLVAIEALLLVLGHRAGARRAALSSLLVGLVPGVLLLLALRESLRGVRWPAIALCLAGAFAAHLADLGVRIARG